MVRVNFLVFGYRRIKVQSEDLKKILALFLHNKISVSAEADGRILISERDFIKFENLLFDYRYEASEPLGIYGYIKRTKHKKGIIAGVILSVILAAFLGNLVWDIRIEGNSEISEKEIRSTLADCGFDIGVSWFSVNKSRVENKFLALSESLAWININRRGTVAYIEVIEAEENEDEGFVPQSGYANIVASETAVIEEITVKHGVAMVKVGDVVKKGDILIAGILPDGFCRAEGSVRGRVFDTAEVEISRSYKICKLMDERLSGLTVKIFNFPVNILKKYGNSYHGCDIIEDVKVFTLSNGIKLPFALVKSYARRYEYIDSLYTDKELTDVASAALSEKNRELLSGADLLRIKTSGEFTESGYIMRSELVFITEIGKTLEFKTD